MKVIIRKPDRGYLDANLWVPKSFVDIEGTKRALTHEFQTYGGVTQFLYLWKESENHMILPRAFWKPGQLPFPVIDCRPRAYPAVAIRSRIKLDHLPKEVNGNITLVPTGKNLQQRALQSLMEYPCGILQLACGKGKTIIALEKIARSKVPALVMLDNGNLLQQWKKQAEDLLDVPGGIGIVDGSSKEWKKPLVLATYHSIANWAETMPEEIRRWFGIVFWDEGHHLPAPMFAKSADLFYGERYSLTATPNRDDGFHVIAEAHIGQVLFKDLTPTMTPTFAFYWTGLELDMKDPTVNVKVVDKNQEVHRSKMFSYFGEWLPRLAKILEICAEAVAYGRKVLLLTSSVDEAVNLYSIWTNGYQPGSLYTDIPIPSPADVGETLNPVALTTKVLKKKQEAKEKLELRIAKLDPRNPDVPHLQAELMLIDQALKQHEIFCKINSELARRQKRYVKDVVGQKSNAGLLTYEVSAEERQKFLDERQVVFAITKYGKEGMDCPTLDTVVVSSLFSSRNGLQQLMGRPTRPMPRKKNPLLIALVDNIGGCIGQSQKLQHHLREWPSEEGGPYEPVFLNYPQQWTRRNKTSHLKVLLSQ